MVAIADEYESLAEYFEDFIADRAKLEKTALPKKTLTLLEEIIRQRIKLPVVGINGVFTINAFEADGIDNIKIALKKVVSIDKDNIKLTYLGAGRYELNIIAPDYKKAEDILARSKDIIEETLGKLKGTIKFERRD